MSFMKQSFLFILLCLGGNAFSAGKEIQLFFQTLEGESFSFQVDDFITMKELYKTVKVNLELKINGREITLIYAGNKLPNDDTKIEKYSLGEQTTIHVVFEKKVNPEELMPRLNIYIKELQDSVSSLRDEKAALEEKIAGLKKQNSFSQAENKELIERIRNLEQDLSLMKGVESELRKKIDEQFRLMKRIAVFHKEENETSRRKIAELNEQMSILNERIKKILNAAERKDQNRRQQLSQVKKALAEANINGDELATTVAALSLRNAEVEAHNKKQDSTLAAVRKKDLLRILRTSSNENPEHRADVKEDLALWPEAARAEVEEASKKISHFIRYHKLRKSLGRAKNIFEDSKKPNRELSKMREILKALDPSQLEVQESMERLFRSLEDIRISNSNKYEEAKAAREEAIKRFVCAAFRR